MLIMEYTHTVMGTEISAHFLFYLLHFRPSILSAYRIMGMLLILTYYVKLYSINK